jgi:hypothetical protein
MPEKEVGA